MNSTKDNVNDGNNNGHGILILNIRSWSKHYDEFLIYLKTLQKENNFYPAVIALTETWISEDQLAYFPIQGYSGYISARQDGTRSGGVILYIQDDIEHTSSTLSAGTFQALSVVFRTAKSDAPKTKEIELLAIYRDQRKSQSEFTKELEHTFLQNARTKAIILGDFNIDLLNQKFRDPLLNLLTVHGFRSNNNQPTRFGVNKHGQCTKTCLDHLHTRDVEILSVEVNDTGITDRRSVLATVRLEAGVQMNNFEEGEKVVSFTNWEKLGKLLGKETWENLNLESVEHAFDEFLEKYKNYKIICTETRTVKLRKKNKKRAPWISNESYHLSILKNSIYKQLGKTDPAQEKYADLKSNFKAVSSQLTKQIRSDKMKYYNERLDNYRSAKEYWRELKMDNKKAQNSVTLTDEKNEKITDPEQIVKILNKHYATVAEQEISKNPIFKTKIPSTYTLNLEKTTLNSFAAFEITAAEVHSAIMNLPNKRSYGNDGITASELKKFCNELLLPLTLLFNFSLKEGTFPNSLKTSGIVPVPKVPKPCRPVDYRPISLLSTVSKVFEAIIQKRMVNFLLKQDFFSKNQFGFLPQRNTSDALVAHLNEIVENLENKKKVIGLYLDLAKAFDT